MGNQRFSITPSTAATDLDMPDSVFRTLAVIGIYGDKNGWCWPSQKTLAKHRGVSRQTIISHIKTLIQLGYLNVIHDFDERGAQKSNKMQIRFDTEYTPPVKPRLDTPCKAKDLTPPVKPRLDTNAPINAPDERFKKEERKDIIKLYQQTIGPVVPSLVDDLVMYEEEFEQEWLEAAFKLAAEKNARKWTYVKTVLDNWKANGRDWFPGKSKEQPIQKREPRMQKIQHPDGTIEEVEVL